MKNRSGEKIKLASIDELLGVVNLGRKNYIAVDINNQIDMVNGELVY